MEKYPLADLVKKWEREEVTVEQTVGQLLLWIGELSERVTRLEATKPGEPSA